MRIKPCYQHQGILFTSATKRTPYFLAGFIHHFIFCYSKLVIFIEKSESIEI
jgi:hypothetical protein